MNRILKIILKVSGFLAVFVVITFGILYAVYNQPLPIGKKGSEADALATKMLKAIHHDAYKKTRYLEWSFAGGKHQYKWDKTNGKVRVQWNDHTVELNLNTPNKSEVYTNNVLELNTENRSDIIEKAIAYFNNDSFWLVAPFKVFDKGTSRSLITLEGGTEALLVQYSSGGTTPGDAYLWKLQANGFPESYQMWVKIIPIGGLQASWENWKVMESGVFLPTSHKLGPVTITMGTVRGYN